MGSLTLKLNNLEVQLSRFQGEGCPRIRANISNLTYSAAGTPIGSGSYYEPKHLWDVTVFCDNLQMQMLKLIYAEHDILRRSQQPADVLIIDETQFYEERLPRTRAIAPDTSIIQLPLSAPTHCLYYAQFKGWFSQEPQFQTMGIYWIARFGLQETDKVAA